MLKIKSHFSAISPPYYIPYFPALIRPIKIFLPYFKAELAMPLYETLRRHKANSHRCHRFCTAAAAEAAPRACATGPCGSTTAFQESTFPGLETRTNTDEMQISPNLPRSHFFFLIFSPRGASERREERGAGRAAAQTGAPIASAVPQRRSSALTHPSAAPTP